MVLYRASLLALLLASSAVGYAQDGLLAQSPFDAETRNLMESLPCTWAALSGRVGPSYGSERFDFSCKAGTWGTVTLLLDASESEPPYVTRIRLGYRDTSRNQPVMAKDAAVAEHFLQTILNRYVPAAHAKRVRNTFWAGSSDRTFLANTRTYTWSEETITGASHWLEVRLPTRPSDAQNTPQPRTQSLGQTGEGLLSTQPKTETIPQAVNIPLNAPSKPDTRGNAPETLLDKLGNLVGVSATQIKPAPYPVLIDPSKLNTAPAQESRVAPTPPPVVSSSLVPDAAVLSGSRAPAPTNFSEYNKAEQLTRDIEQKAAQTTTGLMQQASPTTPAPSLNAVPTPAVQTQPQGAAATGLEAPKQPATQQPEPRFTPDRALPQLKFIPKAEPLDTHTDVIRFEDEGSGL